MKKVLILILSVILVFSLFACSSGKQASAGDSTEPTDLLSQIRSRGVLIIATEGGWAPWTYHDENNELTGFDIELGRMIAKKLNVDVRFEEASWDSILAGVDSGRFDIACNGVSYTDKRAEKYDFTDPYVYTRIVLIVRGDEENITRFDDLKGKKTANTASSIYAGIAEEHGATVLPVDTLGETMQLLLQGRIDATINSEESYLDYISQHPEANLKVVDMAAGDIVCIPVRKGEQSNTLISAINQILAEMRQSGELSQLSKKYFGDDLTNKQ